MKHIFSLFFFTTPLAIYAQPVLTMENCAPVAGTVFEMLELDETSALLPGDSGANVVWDFSTIPTGIASPASNHFYAEPSSSPYYGSHSEATLVKFKGDNNSFFISTPDSLVFVGAHGSSFYNYSSNPYLILPFPFTYLDIASDVSYNSGYSGIDEYTLSIVGDYYADSYGTLVLPGGIILTDVLRVRIEEHEIYHVPQDNYTLDTDRIIYRWYKPGVKEFILEYVQRFPSGWPEYRSAVVQSASSVLEFESKGLDQMSIYPNPIITNGTIDFPSTSGNKMLCLYGADNRLVRKFENINQESLILDHADFESGIYFYVLSAENVEVSTGKIIFQ